MFYDAMAEVHISLTKVHFLGIELYGDEFERFMQAKILLFRQAIKAYKNSMESNDED